MRCAAPRHIAQAIVTGVILLGLAGPGASAQTIPVGTARIDVTPDYPVRLHGYASRRRESQGVQQHIWVKAIAIGSDEAGPSVLITADVLGVSNAIAEQVAERLKREANVPRERIVFGASHTHSAPLVNGVAPNIFGMKVSDPEQAHIDRFTRELTDALGRAGLDALKARRPSKIAWAQGRVEFAMNRRVVKDRRYSGFGETPKGPVDHALPMLAASTEQGALTAVLVNYACHCTTLDPNDNLISGDWADYAQEQIERDHPGATALTLIGCGADSNPKSKTGDRVKNAQEFGGQVAKEVNRLLSATLKPLKTAPTGKLKRITLPLDRLPTREELQKQVSGGGAIGYTARTFLDRLDKGEKLPAAIDYPVQTWAFGDDLMMVFLAGEVVVDYAIRLRRELDPARLWVVAYANDDPCYIPSERILKEGGYEGGGAMTYYALPAPFKPGVEEKIDTAVMSIAPAAFRVTERPPGEAPAPKTPEEGLRSFRVKPGLRIELVASEPAIVDPVAIDWGGDGSLWVCEMHDYPSGLDGRGQPGGRIKRLRDEDGDGFYEKATTFLDGIPFPTGVMAWRGGVLVCSAPEIFYAEDRDHDGRAEIKTTLYSGFATENFQARVNGLSYHVDNWVQGANGLIGGRIKAMARGTEIDIGGRDFRIRPDAGLIEPLAGLTQQGRDHDDWGEEFGGSNSVLIQHYPFADHYARRNTAVPAPPPAVFVPRDADPNALFPISTTLERFNSPESANRVTSACSPTIYRDTWLGAEYAGNAFVCEPVHNLVHRLVLEPDGVTFAGRRAKDERESEFLASTDNWCRPVQVRTGPDGALYVVDMYRYVIEHPRWISPERLANLDVRAGDDKGRIYRVVRDGAPRRAVPNLDELTSAQLAEALDSPNGTLRDQVQMRLVQRGDKSCVPILERLAESSKRAETRMQAMCALDGLGALTPSVIQGALRDPNPLVQRQAVRIGEPYFDRALELAHAAAALIDVPDVRVRFQVALSLGSWNDRGSATSLARLLAARPADPWVRAAAVSSAYRRAAEVLRDVIALERPSDGRESEVGPLIDTIAASGIRSDWREGLSAILARSPNGDARRDYSSIATLLEAGERRGWMDMVDEKLLQTLMVDARAAADDDSLDPSQRAAAIRTLATTPVAAGGADGIARWLTPRNPTPVQVAVIRGLTRRDHAQGVAIVIEAWTSLTPVARGEAIDALIARRSGAEALLAAVRRGDVPAGGIDAARRQRLLRHPESTVRKLAEEVLDAPVAGARKPVLDAYRTALSLKADSTRGAAVFGRVCANCHKFKGTGQEVGPDLAALTDTSFESLLIAVFDPNRDVDARYADYLAALKDGRVVNGLIAAETANAVTLKRAEGREDVLVRTQIESLASTGRSLMPDGLEKDLPLADFADLVAYVSGNHPPKQFAGNRPERTHAAPDGSVRLPASRAAIHGKTLVFEPEFQNLGYWHSDDDRATWTFQTDRPRSYTVTIDYACVNESAGNGFVIRVADRTIRGRVGGTGAWSKYRSLFAGEITLGAGDHALEVRPAGPVQGALMDLRTVVLTPRE